MDIISRKDAQSLGLKRYFTGKSCPAGHISQRYVAGWTCCDCSKSYAADWAISNPCAVKAIVKKCITKNAEKISQRQKVWRDANPNYYANRRISHASEMAKASKKYKEKNKEKVLSWNRNRRAKIAGSNGTHSNQDVQDILRLQKNLCAECRVRLGGKFHVDHILPIALGGENTRKNLQCLCPSCNVRKGASHPLEWAKKKGRLL